MQVPGASPGCGGGKGNDGFGNKQSGAEEIISTTTIVVFWRRVAVLSEHAEDA